MPPKTKDTKSPPKMTWMNHVKKTFEAGKKKNPKYSYKQAMTDAKKTYNK